MNNLNLSNPKMMDVAVPANLQVGLSQEELAERGMSIECEDAKGRVGEEGALFIDVRDRSERERHGTIPGSTLVPYPDLDEHLAPDGVLRRLVAAASGPTIFYCAFGERSAMAVQAAKEAGLDGVVNLRGGIDAWARAGGPLDSP